MSERRRRAASGPRRLAALQRRRKSRTRLAAIGATVCLAALGTAVVPSLLPRLLPDTVSQARSPEPVRTTAEPAPDPRADGTSESPAESTGDGSPRAPRSPEAAETPEAPSSPAATGTPAPGKEPAPGPGKSAGSGKGARSGAGATPGASDPGTVPTSGPGTFVTAPLTGTVPATGTPFRVQVEDGTGVDPTDAARQITAILNDRRGWGQEGAKFRQVTGAEAELTFRVATAATTDKLCNVRQPEHIGEVNCRTGKDVVINLKRWQQGSPEFDGPPVEYRALIVNHEVGHWLGHGHETCPGPGRPAPAMMQQIDGLKGCVSNAWPYDAQGAYLSGPAVP
ncbi:DUF3152 domain-containing protein [Streptomyces graminilatus]|uniref:DUF3152 domain-containing protein n=1 Tax=Streptomyces graminilatus TaxID=1464070 RepID=UPI0006E23753|nr:DUF3152 domain-containing protein [Streptomyces graminilatus]